MDSLLSDPVTIAALSAVQHCALPLLEAFKEIGGDRG